MNIIEEWGGLNPTITAALIGLVGVLLLILFRIWYDRYQEKRKVSRFSVGLRNEIRRIGEDIVGRKPREHPGESWIHGLFKHAKDISGELIGFYETRKGDLDILDDGNLIYKIKRFYEQYSVWKELRQEIIVKLNTKKGLAGEFSPRNPLKEKEKVEEWLIKTTDELTFELDKMIKK